MLVGDAAVMHRRMVRLGFAPAFAEIDAATVFLDDDRAVKASQDKHAVLDRLARGAGRLREIPTRWAEVRARW